ncbi:hypothetical protein OSTOST_01860 [Ostertagia ostertagi]
MIESDSDIMASSLSSVDVEEAGRVDAVDVHPTKPSSSLDELFRDRYTMANESFARISEGFDPVICIHPFHSRARRNFENNGGPHRGGWGNGQRGDWRGGRGGGDWRGGRGGHWRDDRRGRGEWRGERRGQRRPWNDRSDQEEGGLRRPRYE